MDKEIEQFKSDLLESVRQMKKGQRDETEYLLSSPANARQLAASVKQYRETRGMTTAHTYASVWDAIAGTPEQAANMRTRSELMQQIAVIVKDKAWTQTKAAKQCGGDPAAHE